MSMAKDQVVQQGMGLLQASQQDVLGQIYDLVVADVQASGQAAATPATSAVDDQVTAAVAPYKAQIDTLQSELDQAKADLKTAQDADVKDQAQAKADEDKLTAQQAMLDKIKAVFQADQAQAAAQ